MPGAGLTGRELLLPRTGAIPLAGVLPAGRWLALPEPDARTPAPTGSEAAPVSPAAQPRLPEGPVPVRALALGSGRPAGFGRLKPREAVPAALRGPGAAGLTPGIIRPRVPAVWLEAALAQGTALTPHLEPPASTAESAGPACAPCAPLLVTEAARPRPLQPPLGLPTGREAASRVPEPTVGPAEPQAVGVAIPALMAKTKRIASLAPALRSAGLAPGLAPGPKTRQSALIPRGEPRFRAPAVVHTRAPLKPPQKPLAPAPLAPVSLPNATETAAALYTEPPAPIERAAIPPRTRPVALRPLATAEHVLPPAPAPAAAILPPAVRSGEFGLQTRLEPVSGRTVSLPVPRAGVLEVRRGLPPGAEGTVASAPPCIDEKQTPREWPAIAPERPAALPELRARPHARGELRAALLVPAAAQLARDLERGAPAPAGAGFQAPPSMPASARHAGARPLLQCRLPAVVPIDLRPAEDRHTTARAACGAPALRTALPAFRLSAGPGSTVPRPGLLAAGPRARNTAAEIRNEPLGSPSWRVGIRVPQAATAPAPHAFERPPRSLLMPWAPVTLFWYSLPRLFRGVLAAGTLAAAVALLLWAYAGEPVGEYIQRRAAIEISEDFRAGFGEWMGARDWSKTWSYDQAGFVRVGQLALLRPSRKMTDYQMEFLGQIAGTSMGWVYRAEDLENYYAMKIVTAKPGPLPSLVLVRYTVIAGREEQRVQVPIRMMIHNETPYRVRVNVTGDSFTTSIEGQVIDFWRDDRFKRGGVGLFSEKHGDAKIYWIKLSHQTDFLGKLCAYLSPSNAAN